MDPVDGGRGLLLLSQLEQILEDDALIDELGFVHPTQLEALNHQTASEETTSRSKSYDETVFWNRDHKLAVSTTELPRIFISAKKLLFDSIKNYKSSRTHDESLQNDVLRHSRSLLLLCCDNATAWNSRKLVISRNQSLILFMNELRLSSLILSYSPKSENSWSHRRWTIKCIERGSGGLSDIIDQETDLVERIAEKTKMNYRAWNHRCWLVSYMTRCQMLDELKISRKWAELNVADNCCFHLRRVRNNFLDEYDPFIENRNHLIFDLQLQKLMLKIFEHKPIKEDGDEGLLVMSDDYTTWEEEFKWNYLLIHRYIGREALWVHRRFLSLLWLNRLTRNPCLKLDVSSFLQEEMVLVLSCLRLPEDEFEDNRRQSDLSISYLFWVLKASFGWHEELWKKLRGVRELKDLLMKSSSLGKILLWRSFLGRQVWEELFSSN